MLEARDIHWFAGLMEGEGWFGSRPDGRPVIEVTSTDKDVIERIASLFLFGQKDERSLPSGKTCFIWAVTDQECAAGLMMTLLPLMSARRTAKIIECLEIWKARPLPKKRWTHCSHGHPLSGDNLYLYQEGKYVKRRCKICTAERQSKYKASL